MLAKGLKFSLLLFLGNYLISSIDGLPSQPFLLFSNLTTISAVDLTNNSSSVVLGGLKGVVALGYYRVTGKMIYADHTAGKIYKSNLDGSNSELILSRVGNVEGLVVDWVTGKLYWTSYDNLRVEVSNLDGTYMKGLVNTGLENARGIAADPEEGYLFWSDWGIHTAIERCTLAGNNRIKIVTKNLTWPNGLTIDFINKRLYWLDAFHDTISSVKYDGSDRQLTFEDSTVSRYHGFDLDFVKDDLCWTDWKSNSIHCLKITGVPKPIIYKNITVTTDRSLKGVMGIVTIDDSRQPFVTNRCGSNNGGCAQLCLHEPGGFKCACANGFELAADNKGCNDVLKDEFLMFCDADKIYFQPFVSNSFTIPVPFPSGDISEPAALAYFNDMIYVTDITKKTISRGKRDGSQFQTLFDDVGISYGLTIDPAAGNLYWTSSTNGNIEVSRLDGSYRRTLIRWGLDVPMDIVVDPVSGFMYWANQGNSPKIERAYMDSSHRETLVNSTIHWANGLTLDTVHNKLYWVDASYNTIEYLDLGTGKRDVVINEQIVAGWLVATVSDHVVQPFGLTRFGNFLFWTDWYTGALYRATINGGNITRVAGGLSKPMDVHAYSIKPRQDKRLTYTFEFPKYGQNFTCSKLKTCPPISEPPACPVGYTSVRVGLKCNLRCRTISGYYYRCPCRDWMECAVKQYYMNGCHKGETASFKVRECVQDVKPGRCLVNSTGTLQSCTNDNSCSSDEKCCGGKCKSPATISKHPCRTNNGGCDELCIPVPGGHRCACGNGYYYSQTKCIVDLRPTTTPPEDLCPPVPHPGNGTSLCDYKHTSLGDSCYLHCDPGFNIKGWSILICISSSFGGVEWDDPPPICEKKRNPVFDVPCPLNLTFSTDPGLSTAYATWKEPTATDHDGYFVSTTVKPPIKPPVRLDMGVLDVVYTATDYEGLASTCDVRIEVQDNEPPSFGNTCPKDIKRNVREYRSYPVNWKEPTATDNTGSPSVTSARAPNSAFPVGVSSILYTATDTSGNKAHCSFNIDITDICDFVCTEENQPVCASNGKTYPNLCYFRKENCTSATENMKVLKKGPCDCRFQMTHFFQQTSELKCSLDASSLTCAVLCRVGYALAIPEFQSVRCSPTGMIRGNSQKSFVPIGILGGCQRQQFVDNVPDDCPANTEAVAFSYCVLCSPGSYYDDATRTCKECAVGEFQEKPGQNSCKSCLKVSNQRTSTTTGAVSCFVHYGGSHVTLTVKDNFDPKKFKDNIVNLWNNYCEKNSCTKYTSPNQKRRKRSSVVVFDQTHIIILSVHKKSSGTNIVLMVLDPTSTSLVPDKTISSSNLESLIRLVVGKLPVEAINNKVVGDDAKPNKQGGPDKDKDDGGSKAPAIAGGVVAIVVVLAIAFAVFMYVQKKRRDKRRLEEPPVQFQQDASGGQMTMAPQRPPPNQEAIDDGLRHGFVNQVYGEVNPPAYAPGDGQPRHVYDVPGTNVGAEALTKKEPIPDGAVVDVIPPKYEKYGKKRPSSNVNHTPHHYEDPDAELKIDPPPQYDNTKLQILREQVASSILPNVPRSKRNVDTNDNQERGGSSSGAAVHKIDSATHDQSHS